MQRWTLAALGAALIVGATQAAAQSTLPVALEVRGAFAVPADEWTDEDEVENGFGFGVNAQYMASSLIGIYAGWERYQFALEGAELEGVDADATDEGYRAGLQLMLPFPAVSAFGPYLQAGALFNKTSFEFGDDGSSFTFESDSGVGFEVGGGLSIPLGPVISITPGARYRRHDAEFDSLEEFGENDITIGYFVADVGLKIRL